ncbi:MAG: DUF3500 domain-containing protein [Gemmataceae bacterium]|jgi:hypothetical protein|nr:DUF3500 domain-containing protein [Gemmataceae bacterium]
MFPLPNPNTDRRSFLKTTIAGATALTIPSLAARAAEPELGPKPRLVNTVAEDLIKELYSGLDDAQKKLVVKPWNHKDRQTVNPNKALDKLIGNVYTKSQEDLLLKIVKAICSGEDGFHQISRAGTWDASKSFENCGADIFGDPSKGQFAFLLTGHHLTIRCDGDSEPGAAFGGPIYYGHTPDGYDDKKNVFAYQTRAVEKLFRALDEKQQAKAYVQKTPGEGAGSIRLKGEKAPKPGISVSELSKDQVKLMEEVMRTLLSPYRAADADEVMKIIKLTGGMEKIHFAYYTEAEEGFKTSEKRPFSFWRLEGPGFVWNYRVLPHVHTYVNISSKV